MGHVSMFAATFAWQRLSSMCIVFFILKSFLMLVFLLKYMFIYMLLMPGKLPKY